jgi:hypothetical protein
VASFHQKAQASSESLYGALSVGRRYNRFTRSLLP